MCSLLRRDPFGPLPRSWVIRHGLKAVGVRGYRDVVIGRRCSGTDDFCFRVHYKLSVFGSGAPLAGCTKPKKSMPRHGELSI